MWYIYLTLLASLLNTSSLQETGECFCIKFYQCNRTTGTVIDDGSGIIENRNGVTSEKCTCTKKCENDEKCCRLSVTLRSLRQSSCGLRNPEGVDSRRSTVASDVNYGEFPFFVDILTSGAHRCGGSLLHPSVVLTAAHCVVRRQSYTVRAGEWDTSTQHQDRIVESKVIHEDYYPPVHHNDVALLFLRSPLNFTSVIQPVCLPDKDVSVGTERCFAIGRGKDNTGTRKSVPKKVDLPLVGKSLCERALRKTDLGSNFYLHASSICAGGEAGKDTCFEDGGGPLVCPIAGEDERYQQVGVVSWGKGCYQEGVPGVYANVAVLREWIDREMKKKNLDNNFYLFNY